MIHQQNVVCGLSMYWNWVLDWVISDHTTKNVLRGCCTHVLELGIGLGPMRWFTD